MFNVNERMVTLQREHSSDIPIKTIGLILDTYIPTRAKTIPLQVIGVFQHMDWIIHAGDLVSLDVIEDLKQL
jgi:predicted phosphodiesterase